MCNDFTNSNTYFFISILCLLGYFKCSLICIKLYILRVVKVYLSITETKSYQVDNDSFIKVSILFLDTIPSRWQTIKTVLIQQN